MAKKGKNKGYSYRYNQSGTVTCRAYFDMPDGNRTQLSATGKTEEESRKKLLNKYAKIHKEGKQIKSNSYTVKSWLNYWLNEVKTEDLKGGTYDGYYSSFKNHVIPVIGKIKLKDLKLDDIQKVVNKAKKTTFKKYGKTQKISAKGVKEIIAPLKQALIYAMDNDFMPYINFKNLSMPKEKKEKKEKSKSRSSRPKEEQEIVTKYFKNEIPNLPFDLYYAPICVMDLRGIRPEECAGLQWVDIDYEQDILWVGNHTVVKNGTYDKNGKKTGTKIVIEDSTKSKAGNRAMPLGSFLSNLFKAKYQSYLDKGITPKPTDFIFLNKLGNPYYEYSLRKMYKSLAKKLGISEKGCYSLRHEFATSLVRQTDCDNKTIMELMGWSEMIYTYFDTDDEQKQLAIQKIDSQYEKQEDVPLTLINNPTYYEDEEKKLEMQKGNIIPFPIQKIINQ